MTAGTIYFSPTGAKTSSIAIKETAPLKMSQKERVSAGKDVTGEQEQRFSITIETATSIFSSRTTWTSIRPGFGRPSEPGHCSWKGIAVNCGPRGLPAVKPRLYRNDGKGTFRDLTQQSGIGKATAAYGMTVATADFTGDGWLDVYVACDSTPSQLFINQRDGTFVEGALESGMAVSDDGVEQAGMGLALGDYNRDGLLDVFKTNFSDDTNNLYKNLGKGQFTEDSVKAGLAVETRFVNWGAGMPDLDNDGWPDLFYVTGHVFPELERTLPAYPHRGPRIVFRNLGEGRFEELLDPSGHHSSRGAAFGDFDNDGDLDIAVMNMNAPTFTCSGMTCVTRRSVGLK